MSSLLDEQTLDGVYTMATICKARSFLKSKKYFFCSLKPTSVEQFLQKCERAFINVTAEFFQYVFAIRLRQCECS
jgi:hypothetical protein